MNNFGYFYSVWIQFFNKVLKNSGIYKILKNVYEYISLSFSKSGIVSFFKKDIEEEYTEKSVIAKIFRFPFSLLEKINLKYCDRLIRQKENSFVIRNCKYLLHNFLALNLRYIGILALSAGIMDISVSIATGGSVVGPFFIALFGFLLSFFQVNITDFLDGSLISLLFEKLLGTSLKFNFYYVTKCKKGSRHISAIFFGIICGAISSLISPLLAGVFLLGILYVFMVFYKTEFGVFSVAFLAPFVPTMVLAGLCILTIISLIIKALTTKKFTFKFGVSEFLVMFMMLLFLVSVVISYAAKKSIQIFAIYAVFMSFFFVVTNTIKTKKQLFDLVTTVTISSFFVCLYGIMQYVFGWNTTQAWMDEEMFSDIKMRIYSTLENPNVLGEFILLTLPLAIGLMWSKKGVLAKMFYGLVAGCMFIALILTFSRGCWIGLMLSATIFITFVAGKLWGLLLLVLPFLPMFIPESIINRFLSIGDLKDSSTSYRAYIWLGTLLMLKDFWLTGIGVGTEAFTRIYPFYSYSAIVAPHAHNLFLNLLVETGIAGITVFLIICLVFFKRLSNIRWTFKKGADISTLTVAFAASVAGFLLQGLFDNCFYNYRVFMIFWLVLAAGFMGIVAKKEDTGEVKG